MNFSVKHRVTCLFTIEKFNARGEITQSLGPFHNTVVDNGLDGMASYSLEVLTDACHVGTDNTAPTTSDTGLGASVATTTTMHSNASTSGSTDPLYAGCTQTHEFAIGTCTGNLAEVGLSRNNDPTYTFFNRQLFLDAADNPTTITVLADEGLRVTSEVRVYSDVAADGDTTTGSISFDDDGTPIATDWTRVVGGRIWTTSSYRFTQYAICSLECVLLSGANGFDADFSYTGLSFSSIASASLSAYTNGTFTRQATYTFGASAYTGTINSISIGWLGWSNEWYEREYYQPSPAISKTNTEEVVFTFEHTWGRYTPPTTAAPTTAAPTTAAPTTAAPTTV